MTSTAEPHSFIWWLDWLPLAALLGFVIWRYAVAVRNRPTFKKEEIIYQEFTASGASRRNILKKIGGARNCLRLVVARDFLWVTSWFPFSLLAPVYDLEHVIALRDIESVERDRFFISESLILNFVDRSGRKHSLRLYPKNRDRFLAALGIQK